MGPITVGFTDFWRADDEAAIRAHPLFRLLGKRFDLRLSPDPQFLLYSCYGAEFTRYRCPRIFYCSENLRADFSQCDYAFTFDYPADERSHRLPLYVLYDLDALFEARNAEALHAQKSRFCAFVYSNPRASARIEFMRKLSRYKRVDSGGGLLNNIGWRVENKIEFMRPYKFSISFENSSWPGYVTEKLPEALAANTVPIYWGSPLVEHDFNPRAFVNCHAFRNLDEVVDFVVALDNDDALYRRYLGEPAFAGNRPNEFMDETRILDRFEAIFTTPPARPVASTFRGSLDRWRYVPRRYMNHVRAALRGRLR